PATLLSPNRVKGPGLPSNREKLLRFSLLDTFRTALRCPSAGQNPHQCEDFQQPSAETRNRQTGCWSKADLKRRAPSGCMLSRFGGRFDSPEDNCVSGRAREVACEFEFSALQRPGPVSAFLQRRHQHTHYPRPCLLTEGTFEPTRKGVLRI